MRTFPRSARSASSPHGVAPARARSSSEVLSGAPAGYALGLLALLAYACQRAPESAGEQLVGDSATANAVSARRLAPATTLASRLEAHEEKDAAADPAALPPREKQDDGIEDEPPRVYAKTRFVWVRSMPTSDTQWIGFLWTGGSVPLREGTPVPGAGCSKSWYPIEPRGWVCVDDKRATLDPADPLLKALAPYRARLDTPWPHRYAAVPQTIRRFTLLPGPGPQPVPELPNGLQEGRVQMRDRSTFAYVDRFQRGDRAFLLAADMSWVAEDTVEPYAPSEFQGLVLEGDLKLPLAFFRGEDRPGYRPTPDGDFERTEAMFPRLSWVKLTGEKRKAGKETYYETVRDGLWVRRGGAVVPSPRDRTPWGAPVGEPDTTGKAPPGRGTWIEVSVLEGWLVAFEGTRPVYVTLVSSGRGGTPHENRDPLETASTPTGAFSITGKFATATMESPVKIVHSDVPWTQNFSGPHALHGAYWHDNWGSLMSAGCINLSPRDGRWLYDFTDPQVPSGWHGVRHVPRYGPATRLLVHE